MPPPPSRGRPRRLEVAAYILVDSDGEMSDFEEIAREEAGDGADEGFLLVERDPISVVRTRRITIGKDVLCCSTEAVASDDKTTSPSKSAADDDDVRSTNAMAFEEMQQQLADLTLGPVATKKTQYQYDSTARGRGDRFPSFEDIPQRLSILDSQMRQSRVPRPKQEDQPGEPAARIAADKALAAAERVRRNRPGIVDAAQLLRLQREQEQQERPVFSNEPLPSSQVVQNTKMLYERACDMTERKRRDMEVDRAMARLGWGRPPTPPREADSGVSESGRGESGRLFDDKKSGDGLWQSRFPKWD